MVNSIELGASAINSNNLSIILGINPKDKSSNTQIQILKLILKNNISSHIHQQIVYPCIQDHRVSPKNKQINMSTINFN